MQLRGRVRWQVLLQVREEELHLRRQGTRTQESKEVGWGAFSERAEKDEKRSRRVRFRGRRCGRPNPPYQPSQVYE